MQSQPLPPPPPTARPAPPSRVSKLFEKLLLLPGCTLISTTPEGWTLGKGVGGQDSTYTPFDRNKSDWHSSFSRTPPSPASVFSHPSSGPHTKGVLDHYLTKQQQAATESALPSRAATPGVQRCWSRQASPSSSSQEHSLSRQGGCCSFPQRRAFAQH